MTHLAGLLKSQEKIFAARLSLARSAVKHPTQKGDILEDAARSVLRDFLPEKIGVASGVVVSANGDISRQIDIILYDQVEAHLFFKSEKTVAVPIEYVFAIGEVKSIIDKQKFTNFQKVQSEIKLFPQNYSNPKHTYRGYGVDWSSRPIASFLICFDAEAEKCFKWAQENAAHLPINLCIDTILCPEHFNVHWVTEYGPDLMQGTPLKIQCVKEQSLYFFLGILSKAATYWKMYDPVSMYKYYQSDGRVRHFMDSDIHSSNLAHYAINPAPPSSDS
tara:strand:- start:412 stop:1239 length:828 start_codon:yes stop_codon:yes gene_type:complete